MVALCHTICRGYADIRKPDPRIAEAIRLALGDANSDVNVGAGTGSYEPLDRYVVAVEPSMMMIDQRPARSARSSIPNFDVICCSNDRSVILIGTTDGRGDSCPFS